MANKEYDTKIYIKLVIILFCINLAPAKSIEILIPKSVFEINSHKSFILKIKKILLIFQISLEKIMKIKHYVLIDNDDGYYHNFFKIYLYPELINKECWSFKNNPINSTYNFNCSLNDEQYFNNLVKDYDIIINYNNIEKYNKLIKQNNFVFLKQISNSSIYAKIKLVVINHISFIFRDVIN